MEPKNWSNFSFNWVLSIKRTPLDLVGQPRPNSTVGTVVALRLPCAPQRIKWTCQITSDKNQEYKYSHQITNLSQFSDTIFSHKILQEHNFTRTQFSNANSRAQFLEPNYKNTILVAIARAQFNVTKDSTQFSGHNSTGTGIPVQRFNTRTFQ